MAAGKQAIGVMGGTFDPIHFGHLVTAEAACEAYALEKVIFVPAGRPPHKVARNISDPRHRYLMTVLATIDNPRFAVSRVELDRPGYSYTVDTLRILLGEYPGREIYFITGADAVLEICSWRDPWSVLELCHFIAASRPGYHLQSLDRLRATLDELYDQRVHPLTVPALAISSSDIRERVRQERSIRYLLPASVEHYVQKHGLYRQASQDGCDRVGCQEG